MPLHFKIIINEYNFGTILVCIEAALGWTKDSHVVVYSAAAVEIIPFPPYFWKQKRI